jgi:hypothetical protein
VYRSRGGNYNSLEAILTETANAYRQSPWTICKEEPSSRDGIMALALELQSPPTKQEARTNLGNQEELTLPDEENQPRSPDTPRLSGGCDRSLPGLTGGAPLGVSSTFVGEGSGPRHFINEELTSVEHQEPESESPMTSDQDDYDPLTCDHPLHKGHPIEVHKSIIQLAKLKGLIDEIDIPDVQDARCETCANCPACKLSAREKTKSLQEEFEQDIIKKSIEIDPAHGVVFANLPFLRDPVEYLTKKHGGNNNRYQAARIYQAQ